MRTKVGYANTFNLQFANPAIPVISDKLFTGLFAHQTLVDGIILRVCITATGGNPTIASLGNITIKDTQSGNKTTFPLQMWVTIAPFLCIPCNTVAATGSLIIYIPIPFSLIQGVRPKDTYLISEKCNDFYIEVSGLAEQGLTYTAYSIDVLTIGEGNKNVYLPSDAPIMFSQDTIPAGNWYDAKFNIIGASWIGLMLNTYGNIGATDQLNLVVDGVEMQRYARVHDANRIYAYARQRQTSMIALDTIPATMVLIPLSLDKKQAKISRSSIYQVRYFNNSGNPYTMYALYQQIRPKSMDETIRDAVRQNPNIDPTDVALSAVPVDSMGKMRRNLKPLSKKLLVADGKGDYQRVANKA